MNKSREFANGVIHWMLEDERMSALDRTGDESDAAEWVDFDGEMSFTLHDDERSRALVANLEKFYRERFDDLRELAWRGNCGTMQDLDASAYMSLVGHGSGLWDVYLGADQVNRDYVETLGNELHDALIETCGHIEVMAEPSGLVHVA